VATLLGAGLLHERIGAVGVIALLVILAGSWLATQAARPKFGPMKRVT
jgi:drug/metabolite transporter (DMT)-like permease